MKTIQTTSATPILRDLKISLPSLRSIVIAIAITTILFQSFVPTYVFWVAISVLIIALSQSIYQLSKDIDFISFDDEEYSVTLEDIINDLENR